MYIKQYVNGFLLSLFIAILAILLGKFISIGAVAIAILLGIVIGNMFKIGNSFSKGITFSEKTLLAYAIAFMGINLDFVILNHLGIKSIGLIVIAMIVTILFAVTLAKLFNFDKKFALILGIGNGVCGSAAIAATKDIVGLNKDKTVLSIAIVNFLGTIGIFLLPLLGSYVLNLSDINNGILIGNTLQAVGQVIAGGFSVSDASGQTATIVKMGRILLLTPLIFLLIYIFHKQSSEDKVLKKATIPMFIVGFVFFSIIATLHILPDFIVVIIKNISHYLLIVAMAAIGLGINFKTMIKHGSQALLIGSLIFLVQILFTGLILLILF